MLLLTGITTWEKCALLYLHWLIKLINNPVIISGTRTTVEIDVGLFTLRKNQVGRVLPQQWVFGGICRETKECFMFHIPDRTAAPLLPIIRQSILPGTTILFNQWAANNGTAAVGYNHNTVNHSVNFINPATGAHTQNIERDRCTYSKHRAELESRKGVKQKT